MRSLVAILPLLTALALLLAGCCSYDAHARKAPIMAAYLAGDQAQAAAALEKNLDRGCDGVMWRLENGSFAFSRADYEGAVEHFKAAEEAIAEYDGRATVSVRDVASSTGSLLINDTSRPYRGSCRDRIALCLYKALAYLGAGREDAFRAQIRRLRDAQKEAREQYGLEDDAASKAAARQREEHPEVAGAQADEAGLLQGNADFAAMMAQCDSLVPDATADYVNPAALFLSGLSSLRDGNPGGAAIDFREAVAGQPANATLRQYLRAAQTAAGQRLSAEAAAVPDMPFPLDCQCVYVIFGHGRTAALNQRRLYIPVPAGIVPAAWAYCEFYPSPFRGLTAATAQARSDAALLANMDAILAREYKLAQAGMITRIILRATIYAVSQEVIRQSDMDPLAKNLALIALSASAVIFNSADTRTWELLPKEIMLAQVPMPPDRRLTLTLHAEDGLDHEIPVTLEQGFGSAIVYVNAPSLANISVHVLPLRK